jgi:hypothetical protein
VSTKLKGPLLLFLFGASMWLAGDAVERGLVGDQAAVQPRAVTICRDAVVLTGRTDYQGRMAECAAASRGAPATGIRRTSRMVKA